jgi:hypothetical protein
MSPLVCVELAAGVRAVPCERSGRVEPQHARDLVNGPVAWSPNTPETDEPPVKDRRLMLLRSFAFGSDDPDATRFLALAARGDLELDALALGQ